MKEDRLSGLALMQIQKLDVSFNSKDMVDDLAAVRLEAEGWSSFIRLANSSTFSNGNSFMSRFHMNSRLFHLKCLIRL